MAANNTYVCAYFDEDRSISVLPSKKCRHNVRTTVRDMDRPNVSPNNHNSITTSAHVMDPASDKFEFGQEIEVNWPKNRKARWWKGIVVKAG